MGMLVFDTETTGIPFHPSSKPDVQPRVIEFGAVLLDDEWEVVEECELLINPGAPLPAIITKITGLTDDDLADAPGFDEVYPKIEALFGRADAVAAHNLPFDLTMLELDITRLDLAPLDLGGKRLICTVQEHFEEFGKRMKLQQLYEHYTGGPLRQTHRALDDVMALATVVRASL